MTRPPILWTEKMDQIVRDGYAIDTPLIELAERLDLPRVRIQARARALGLTDPERQKRAASKVLKMIKDDPAVKAARVLALKDYQAERRLSCVSQ